jgi:hypothetical protein
MVRALSVAAVLGLFAGPVCGQDGQTYTIKVKEQADRARVHKSDAWRNQFKLAGSEGNVLKEQDEKKGNEEDYTEEVLERKGKKRLRLKRQYAKARVVDGAETRILPYEGKMVLIEKKGDRYTFRLEGDEELTGKDASQLESEFNRKKDRPSNEEFEKLILPGKAVKVGETWKLDKALLAKLLPSDKEVTVDTQKSKAVGKLTKVYRKDGRQFGVIDVQVHLFPKAISADGKEITLTPTSKVTVTMKMDVCIDGSVATGVATVSLVFHIESVLPSENEPMFRFLVDVTGKLNYRHVEQ